MRWRNWLSKSDNASNTPARLSFHIIYSFTELGEVVSVKYRRAHFDILNINLFQIMTYSKLWSTGSWTPEVWWTRNVHDQGHWKPRAGSCIFSSVRFLLRLTWECIRLGRWTSFSEKFIARYSKHSRVADGSGGVFCLMWAYRVTQEIQSARAERHYRPRFLGCIKCAVIYVVCS